MFIFPIKWSLEFESLKKGAQFMLSESFTVDLIKYVSELCNCRKWTDGNACAMNKISSVLWLAV